MDGTLEFFEKNYEVKRIDMQLAKAYIKEHHYTRTCHNAPSPCFGLYEKDELIGVLMFAQPCSEAVRGSIWGAEYKNRVIELHRLHILDVTPRNTESWFIKKCFEGLKQEKPYIKGIISFADSTEGHEGIIYRATNFYFIGKTSRVRFYRDTEGRLRHPRQNGVNISIEQASEWGWKPEMRLSKNRYLYILADNKREKKELIKSCRYDLLHSEWCKLCGREYKKGEVCKCSKLSNSK